MLFSAIIFGLLGSFHCIGMCGPIAFMLPVNRTNNTKRILQVSFYHIGRLVTYGILGLLFGFLGKGFYLFGFQQYLSIIIGVIMILMIVLPKKTINNDYFKNIQNKNKKPELKTSQIFDEKTNNKFKELIEDDIL